MAGYTLPKINEVNDFLKSKGVDTSLSGKSSLYSSFGNKDKFIGSPAQNDLLRTSMTTPATNGIPSQVPTKTSSMKLPASVQTLFDVSQKTSVAPQPIAPPFPNQSTASTPIAPPFPTAPAPSDKGGEASISKTYTTPSGAQVSVDGKGNTSLVSSPQNGGTTTTISASDVLPNASDSEGDYLSEFLNSSEGQLLLDRASLGELTAEGVAGSAKQALEAKYATDKSSLEQKLAENGLAFSGIRATQVKSLTDALAASELDVDRTLASKLMDSDLDLREGIIKGVADLAKRAADDDKEAIAQLNKAGWAVVGDKLVPTFEAQREERIAAAQDLANQIAIARLNNDNTSLQIAIEKLNIDLRKEAREMQDDQYNPGGYTDSELRQLRNAGIDSADIKSSDDFLYGVPSYPAVMNVNQLQDIATGILSAKDDKGKKVFKDADAAIEYIQKSPVVEINKKPIHLSPVQKQVLIELLQSD